MSKVTARLIIEADYQDSGDDTQSHPPYWYRNADHNTGTQSHPPYWYLQKANQQNPASHPPPWALIDMHFESPYSEGANYKQKLDSSDAFITVVSTGSSITGVKAGVGARLRDAKFIVIKNCGDVAAEILIKTNEHAAADETRSNAMYSSMILGSSEFIVLPNQRLVSYSSNTSAANAASIDNVNPYLINDNLECQSGARTTEAFSNDADTNIQCDDGSSGAVNHKFRVGDIIRIENEILEVTAITDPAGDGEYTPTNLTVKRGLFGSTAANHADNDHISYAFFNEYSDYDKFTYAQTDKSGRYKTSNLVLNNSQRSTTAYTRGIVRGSFALKFYERGYQELGLSGITNSTSSGLATSTEYKFNITADGGSVFSNLTFTTDSNNVNFGGRNGVISKINDALATQYSTYGGNLFEKEVTVSIVNGDIRFTSGNRTTASAILLAAPTSGTTPFGVGRFPAIGSVEAAVAAKLPDDTVRNQSYVENPNKAVFAYDDGRGNIRGAAQGTINYETSGIDLTSAPADAEFVVSFNYNSVHSGGVNETSNFENGIINIQARSCNSKVNGEVEVIGFM